MDSNEKKAKRPRIGEMRSNSLENPESGISITRSEPAHSTSTINSGENSSFSAGQRQDYPRQQRPYNPQNRQGGYQQRPGGYHNMRPGGYQGGYQQRYQPRTAPQATEGGESSEESTTTQTPVQQSSGYQPRYNPQAHREGGYQQRYNPQGGYQQRPGGYNNRQGGYQQRQGGYNNRQGGYQQRPGGYNNRQGGYGSTPRQEGYSPNQRPGGYNAQRQGGYGNRQGGYNNPANRRQGGYNNPNNRRMQPKQRANQFGMPQGGKSFVPRPKRIEYEQSIPTPDEQIRLNKFMANAGICSRREADEFIQQGLVKVNGEVVTELGTKITHSDTVEYNGKVVTLESKCYILLNKPKDCVTTSDDPNGRTTVLDLVKGACEERIYPVGRLDRNTTGVLLLTNDGDLASKLTHPKYVKKKIYHVWCDKDITEEDMQRIADGIELDDGPIHADAISYATDVDRNQAGIEIHSGRNRIVRRIFESLGYHVTKLDRVYFAGLTKKNLPRGRWRYLTQEEVNFLKMGSFE